MHAALAHRRLSIVDLGTGQQPLSNEDGSVWIVFNGEIYNHAEIRQELEAHGHRYRTKSDTESIVHAYEQWGEDCVHRFRGMFAVRHLGRAAAATAARARPAWNQAALLVADRATRCSSGRRSRPFWRAAWSRRKPTGMCFQRR